MKIIGTDRIVSPCIVVGGQHGNIALFEEYMHQTRKVTKVVVPNPTTYFQDYPEEAEKLHNLMTHQIGDELIMIETQSLEFLDALLESSLDFDVVTVRKVGDDLRLRCLTKQEAKQDREMFSFDYRV